MAKKKRRTLPKDFREILDRGDISEIKSVFDLCDVNSVGGYGKETAIAFNNIPDDVVRWLVGNGADLSLKNTWGRSALHERAGSRRGSIVVLLELGANISATDNYGNTPLHSAASFQNSVSAKLLLNHGAKVDAVNNEGLTPIELGLRRCQNIDIENAVNLTRALTEAGAIKSTRCKEFVQTIGKTFEFHREGFNRDSVESVATSLNALYEIFDVPAIPRRMNYDGVSPIIPRATVWQKQHEELWNMLVPSSGQASTAQGEAVRISGRVSNEIEGNGGVNWDADFSKMAKNLVNILKQGVPLSLSEIDEADAIVRSIKSKINGSTRLAELAVAWVVKNPTPIPLGIASYKR